MIVMTRNGRTVIVTGWRAWIAGTAIFLAVVALLAVVFFFLFGLFVTVMLVLLIVVPVAIGMALLASVFGRDSDR